MVYNIKRQKVLCKILPESSFTVGSGIKKGCQWQKSPNKRLLRDCNLHSHNVSLVQWTTRLLPVMRDPGSNPQGGTFVKPGFFC
jgi:hypothetical protein